METPMEDKMQKVNIREELAKVDEHWPQRIILKKEVPILRTRKFLLGIPGLVKLLSNYINSQRISTAISIGIKLTVAISDRRCLITSNKVYFQ